MKKLLLSIYLVSCFGSIYAQRDLLNINGLNVGVTPSALLNVWTGYQARIGYSFMDQFEIELNSGYLIGQRSESSYSGYRNRITGKYYFQKGKQFEKRNYVGIGYLSRNTIEMYYESYNMFNGAFIEEILQKRKKSLTGIYVITGIRQTIDDSNFFYDLGMGAGIGGGRIKVDLEKAPPPNGVLISDNDFFTPFVSAGENSFQIFFLHFSFGYKF